jgi:hypothetical protein
MAKLREELATEEAAKAAGGAPPPPPAAAAAGEEEEGVETGDELPGEAAGEGAGGEAEGAEAGAAGEAGGDDDDFVVVSLPARKAGEEDFELPLDIAALEAAGIDPADAVERLNQLRNGAMYRREYEDAIADVQKDKADLDGIYEAMEADPAAFLMETVAPTVRSSVVEALLLELEEEHFDKLVRKINTWARDPNSRVTQRTDAENKRLKAERERTRSSATVAKTQDLIRDIGAAIRSVLPDDYDPKKAKMFSMQAAAELNAHLKATKQTTLDPAKVPELLGELGVLEFFGISPTKNGERSASGVTPPKAPGKKPAAVKGKAPDVRERMRRRKGAATTPGGAGSAAPAGFTKVPGETYTDRRNRLSRALGLPEKAPKP